MFLNTRNLHACSERLFSRSRCVFLCVSVSVRADSEVVKETGGAGDVAGQQEGGGAVVFPRSR